MSLFLTVIVKYGIKLSIFIPQIFNKTLQLADFTFIYCASETIKYT